MNGVQTRFKCKLDVKRCKRFVFPPSSLLPRSNALKTKAIRYFQTDRTLTRIVSPPLYVTHKIATQSWQASGGNRRKEALPHWCYQRGIQYEDGLYLPTKKEPLTDGITGATPKGSFNVKMSPTGKLKKFIVKIEINHSTDFNDAYPKSAKEGDANYSGGKEGSGQPALVYATEVDLASGKKEFVASLIGHSSPDGSNGNITKDTSSLTTALHIVKKITICTQ